MTTTDAAAHATDSDHGEHHHALPLWLLVMTWLALMSLTGLTVFLGTTFDLGAFELPVAMGIATIKAILVMFIFMHLGFDKPFHSLLIVGSLLFVFLFIGFAMMDRGQYDPQVQAKSEYEIRRGGE